MILFVVLISLLFVDAWSLCGVPEKKCYFPKEDDDLNIMYYVSAVSTQEDPPPPSIADVILE